MKLVCALAAIAALVSTTAQAAPNGLVERLAEGGYVLVMRHVHAPGAPPAAGAADPGNPQGERQLDAQGRAEAAALGEALKARRIATAAVYASPAFRAMQTARLAGLDAEPRPEIGDGGSSMASLASGASGDAWLKAKAAERPPSGANTLLITHAPNISRAFALNDVADGEALVFRPDGRGASPLIGRIKIGDWRAP